MTVFASRGRPSDNISPLEARRLLVRLLRQRAGRVRTGPLSFAQERLWFVEQMHPGSAAYHLPVLLPMSDALDDGVLQRTVDELARRHETLRTSFIVSNGVPVQRVMEPGPVAIERIDVTTLEEMQAVVAERSARPFDLENGPLFRVHLVRGGGSTAVLFNTHHLVSDGWSLGVFLRELRTLYAAFNAGQPSPLSELPMQYVDFARWQREALAGVALEDGVAFWKEMLAGAPPLLDFPTDRPRPMIESLAGAIVSFGVTASVTERLETLARAHDATLYMLLLAIFSGLLARLSGQDQVVVGSPVANRTRPEVEPLIGFFVNMLPLRCDLRGDPSLRELLARVRTMAVAAFGRQDLPFEKLVEVLQPRRSLGHSPIFQVVLTLQNAPADELDDIPRGEVDSTPVPSTAKFDISLSLQAGKHGIFGSCEYRTALFDTITIQTLIERFTSLLERLPLDPELPLSRWPVVSPQDAAAMEKMLSGGDGEIASLLRFGGQSRVAIAGEPPFADVFPGSRTADLRSATHVYITPTALARLRPADVPSAQAIIVSGPPCFDVAPRAWRGKVPVRELWSFPDVGFVALDGRPLSGVRIALGGAPFGVWSELSAARRGKPFRTTRQLVRLRRDGTLQWRGSLERMRLVHGTARDPYRIEALLRQQPFIDDAAVIAHEDSLFAVVQPVRGRNVLAPVIAQLLRQQDLESSVDRIIVADVPRGDREALARLASESENSDLFVGSRTPVEAILSRIWSEVLARPYVDVRENFFDVGGNSLTSVQVIARIRDALRVDLPLHRLFEAPTIEELARLVEAEYEPAADGTAEGTAEEVAEEVADAGVLPRVRRAPPGSRRRAPLSFTQERLWFLDQLDGASTVYNVLNVVPLAAWIDPAIVQRAVAEIVRRHDVLRTSFPSLGGTPQQVIADYEAPRVSLLDLGELPRDEVPGELARICDAESRKPFDLAYGPLFRAKLVLCGPEGAYLLVSTHHIVWDGWSSDIFSRELLALYAAFSSGEASPLPELQVQYTDFARWQRRWMTDARLAPHLEYWSSRLRGLSELVSFPPDASRPAVETHRGAARAFRLPATLAAALRELAQRERTTLFSVLLAGFAALLSRLTGLDDIVVGSPVANRTRAEIEPLLGFFANTLVLRVDTGGDPSFAELLSRAHSVIVEATEHQDLPFERLVEALQPERSLNRNPLFQSMLVLQRSAAAELPAAETLLVGPPIATTAKFDATLTLQENGGTLDGTIEYATDLFHHDTAERVVRELATLLAAACADPSSRLTDLPLADASETEAWLRSANAPCAPAPFESVVSLFERTAERLSGATAVVSGDDSVTYGELDARANRLARKLMRGGVRRGDAVAISLPRGIDMMVAVLGVLKCGAAYVPVDPSYPSARREVMLDMARCAAVIAAPSDVDADDDASSPRVEIAAGQLCYLIFTSGSTGMPKGVGMPHRAMTNLIRWHLDHPELSRPATALQFSSLSFDVSFQELFSTWCGGGTLVLTTDEIRSDPARLLEQLAACGVDRLFMPYVAIQQLAEAAGSAETLPPLREVISAGEQLRVTTGIREFFRRMPGCVLRNQYGPTESHIMTDYCLSGSPDSWPRLPPIGKPIANATAYLLDARMRPVPQGVIGELYLGGECVAAGYVRQPRLTADRFVPDPWGRGRVLYRTGDRGRWLANGEIDYFGRGDDQVKVRGFRIEPGEVEAAILQLPEIQEAVVLAHGDSPETRKLVAYVVFKMGGQCGAAEIAPALQRVLPHYMVPSIVVPLELMPLTPSGKIARRALPPPAVTTVQNDRGHATPLARLIAGQWDELLGFSIGVQANFFASGGHSLLATQALSKLRAATGVDVPLRLLFERPTVESLAAAVIEIVHERAASQGGESLVAVLERQFGLR